MAREAHYVALPGAVRDTTGIAQVGSCLPDVLSSVGHDGLVRLKERCDCAGALGNDGYLQLLVLCINAPATGPSQIPRPEPDASGMSTRSPEGSVPLLQRIPIGRQSRSR